MTAEFSGKYYYLKSDSDSFAGEESEILRVEAKEFEDFVIKKANELKKAKKVGQNENLQHSK